MHLSKQYFTKAVFTFPSRIDDIRSFMLNMELSLSPRPLQEVTSGSSIPSSGPNGESRAPVLIDCPHSPFKSHRRHIKLKNEALSPSARIAAADLAAKSPLQFITKALKGNPQD